MSKETKSESTTTTKTASNADSSQKETPAIADKEQKSETTTTTTKTASTQDAGQKEMQAIADKENKQGFVGEAVDPTDNEAYTVKGVTSGMPTPETDPEIAGARMPQQKSKI